MTGSNAADDFRSYQLQQDQDSALRRPPAWQQKDEFLAATLQIEEHLEGIQQAAEAGLQMVQAAMQGLMQACAAARDAQRVLHSQADKLGVLASADASGEADANPQVAAAMEEMEAAFSRRGHTLNAAKDAMKVVKVAHELTGPFIFTHDFQPAIDRQGTAAVPLNRMWNQARSKLLQLPDAALHLIARKAGKPARLTCRRMVDVYGTPGAIVEWTLDKCDWFNQEETLAKLVRSWRWRHHMQELRLPKGLHISQPMRYVLVDALPSLQRLTVRGPKHNENASALPVWASLTAVTCTVDSHSPPALPFKVPNLRRLKLRLVSAHNTMQHLGLVASLQPLVALTHLQIAGVGPLHPHAQQELADALATLAPHLVSLHLSGAFCLANDLTVLTQLRLQRLAVQGWECAALPPLLCMPHLCHLELLGDGEGADAPENSLRQLLQWGSPCLQSLTLAEMPDLEAGTLTAIHSVLRDAWPLLPSLTSLEMPTVDVEGMPGLARLSALQRLSLRMLAGELTLVSCLQPLASLTCLQLSIDCGSLSRDAAIEAAAPVARLTQLRSLALLRSSGLLCVRHAASLPQLHELDLVGVRGLRDEHEALLRPLLAPGCSVRCLKVHEDSPPALDVLAARVFAAEGLAALGLGAQPPSVPGWVGAVPVTGPAAAVGDNGGAAIVGVGGGSGRGGAEGCDPAAGNAPVGMSGLLAMLALKMEVLWLPHAAWKKEEGHRGGVR